MLECVTVMAGGQGTRLWPSSQQACPKQFLPFAGSSLFERTLKRAFALKPQCLLIVLSNMQLAAASKICNQLAKKSKTTFQLLVEPQGCNTAAALTLATCWVKKELGEGTHQLVLAADHLIAEEQLFTKSVEKALLLSEERLVVFGIAPQYPETGYGYIEKGRVLGHGFQVKRFIEKPHLERVHQLLATGNCYWNSGMFCYRNDIFWNELAQHAPALKDMFEDSTGFFSLTNTDAFNLYQATAKLIDIYKRVPRLSIDQALMEKSSKVAMLEADFSWSDVGSWDAIAELDARMGFTQNTAQVIAVESHNNYVSAHSSVALCGVSDLIVIEENGYLLICKKGQSQLVKKVIPQLSTPPQEDNRSI